MSRVLELLDGGLQRAPHVLESQQPARHRLLHEGIAVHLSHHRRLVLLLDKDHATISVPASPSSGLLAEVHRENDV